MAVASPDPTPEEVAAAIATLTAFEHAQHPLVEVAPVTPSEVILPPPAAPAVLAPIHEAPVDSYLARSVKSSPNGF
jgi:hypothetical protein